MSFIETAVNNFMLLQITVRKADPMKRSKVASDAAATECRVNRTVPVNTRVGALGTLTTDLKAVNSKYVALHSYMYENTLPFTEAEEGQHKRGKRLIHVLQVPEVLSILAGMKREAKAALVEFMPRYREYYEARDRVDLGLVSDVDMPTPEALAAKYDVVISPPQPIPVFAADKLQLPAGLAAEIAKRHEQTLVKQLEGAKNTAMKGAKDHMDLVERQLTDGKRLHQSLLDNAKTHATLLRGMVKGYDNDPRVLQLADLIDEQIGSIASIEYVKHSTIVRDRAVRAAKTVSKGLSDLAAAPKSSPAPISADSIVAGDSLLADLID
jgi:hypothetical protein